MYFKESTLQQFWAITNYNPQNTLAGFDSHQNKQQYFTKT